MFEHPIVSRLCFDGELDDDYTCKCGEPIAWVDGYGEGLCESCAEDMILNMDTNELMTKLGWDRA